jgi:hypothetical protein
VFAGDIGAAVLAAVEGRAAAGQIYELGGPEVKSFKELMEFVLATIERRRLLVPIPFALASLQAMFLQLLPKPLLTPDQVELLKRDNVVSGSQARGAHACGPGIGPTAMAAVVPSYSGASARRKFNVRERTVHPFQRVSGSCSVRNATTRGCAASIVQRVTDGVGNGDPSVPRVAGLARHQVVSRPWRTTAGREQRDRERRVGRPERRSIGARDPD